MRTGPRLRIIQCVKGAKILQPTYRFGSSTTSSYVPLEVFLLNGDSGQISILNRTLNWVRFLIFTVQKLYITSLVAIWFCRFLFLFYKQIIFCKFKNVRNKKSLPVGGIKNSCVLCAKNWNVVQTNKIMKSLTLLLCWMIGLF
jgi:hypothetical protein